VLSEVAGEGFDRVVMGGDVVPGPMSAGCLDALDALTIPVEWIRGNGDRDALRTLAGEVPTRVPEAFRGVVRWSAEELSAQQVAHMADWPRTVRLEMSAFGAVLFCHATPRDDAELFTRLTPEDRLRPVFEPTAAELVVCGHTHMQFDRWVGDVRVVNAGSVGMPFDAPGAYWLALDREVTLRRTDYDREAAAARIRGSAYPQAQAFADGNVLETPEREAMERTFEAAALTP